MQSLKHSTMLKSQVRESKKAPIVAWALKENMELRGFLSELADLHNENRFI